MNTGMYQTFEQTKRRAEIRKVFTLPAHKWQWHVTFSPPKSYNKDLPGFRTLLYRFCRSIEKREKVLISTAAALFVLRPGSPPHAHMLMVSLPVTHGNTLDDLSPQDMLRKYWPYNGHIVTHNERTQEQMINYITNEDNLFIDAHSPGTNEWFFYRRGLYNKLHEGGTA